ncbi:MAG TPA: cell division ATP-binding protein FtsE [Candidatus Deferrimicrobium sp.]|nr:cell division ATP-binding protein FtsE [Candidatus Deferrimicrobium sp.]
MFIQLSNASKTYPNGVRALIDASLRINKGDFVFLIGPSGAGKSTIIKMLFLEETVSRGQVIVNGKNLSRLSNGRIPYLRRNIGIIFQDFKLLPTKSVYDNVAFALQVVGASSHEIKEKVPAVLALVGLQKKADFLPTQLSGGEQQRVCIARAVVNNPALVLADEPTGNLDPDTSYEIMQLLLDINKRGTTIVMSTHAKDIVDSLQKRVIALEGGRIVRDDEKGVYGYES